MASPTYQLIIMCLISCEMYVPYTGAVGIFPDKSEKLTMLKSNASLLSKIEQTKSPFEMSISKSKYDTTFLDSDISETTCSSG